MRVAPVALSLILVAAAAAAAAAEPLPTADDLQKLADAKDWPALLLATTRVLTLKGDSAVGVDRVDAWLKKAEALLQSDQFVPAAQAFEKAADEPNVAQDKADFAVALAAVVRKSDRQGYKPPATKAAPQRDPIVIADPAKRPAAIAAYFDGAMADLNQRIDRHKTATATGPLLELVKQAKALQPVDRAANKSTDQTDAAQTKIAGNFVAGAQAWSDATGKRLAVIQADADTQIRQSFKDANGREAIRLQRKGMSPAAQGEVRKLMTAGETLAGAYTTLDPALSAAGKTALAPAKASIQSTYDQAKAALSSAFRPATP